MLPSSYARFTGVARNIWSDGEFSFAGGAPAAGSKTSPSAVSVLSLGQKLSRATKSAKAVSMRRSSEVGSAGTQGGDGIDRALMRRIVDRDEEAFAALAERHASTALGLAQRIVRNAADAEDIVQESLTRLWVFADRWNPDTARFSSWFYRIVTNQAISRIRRKSTEPLDAVEEPSDSSPNPHDALAGREIGEAITHAIAQLPERQRAAIALCYDQGLSCAQAAESMGVSIGTMESLLFRARRSLREWLAPFSAELEER